MGTVAGLPEGQRIYLDANVFIYHLEGYPGFERVLPEVFAAFEEERLFAWTSHLALAEVLVKPFQDGNTELQNAYRAFIRNRRGLMVAPLSEDVMIGAAQLRAKYRALRLPDAIHLAAARYARCNAILTNDRRLLQFPETRAFLLSDLLNA